MSTFLDFNNFKSYIQVVDVRTGKVLCSGKYKNSYTVNPQCISLDDVYYWRCEPNQKYKIEKLPILSTIVQCQAKDLPSDYILAPLESNINADVYIGKTIEECDTAVKPLVTILNKIQDLETVSSGDGHDNDYARVSFKVTTLKPLLLLSQVIDNVFPGCWRLVTNEHVFNGEGSQNFYISLESLKKGQESFKDIKDLTTYLIKEIL